MDKLSRKISQKTMQFLSSKGYKVLSEFALPNKKRVDIIAINSKKEIIIVEVKSKKSDVKTDKKWKNGVSRFVLLEGMNHPTIVEGIERDVVVKVLESLQR